MVTQIHLSAEGEKPHAGVKRKKGRTNVGLYCNQCDEFFALAVHDAPPGQIKMISDGDPLFECPFCHQQQRRSVSEIAEFVLTEAKKRRPPIPRDAN